MINKYQLNQEETQILNKKIIELYYQICFKDVNYDITPEQQDNPMYATVAMQLAYLGCLVPRYWMHDYKIECILGERLDQMMRYHSTPVPHEYQDIDKMSIFDKAYFGIVPDINGHKPDEQDEDGFTVAMILTLNDIKIPEYWYHDPNIQNRYGYTVAMYQAENKMIPDKQWYNDPQIQNKNGKTIAMILINKKLMIPRELMHNYNIQDKDQHSLKYYLQHNNIYIPHHWKDNNMTIFDQAYFGIIPDIEGHNSSEQDENGFTIAMIMAYSGLIPTKKWHHNSSIQNSYGETVAMILAKNGIIPPKQWYHNHLIHNKQYDTVAINLINNKILPPQEWKHVINPSNIDIYCIRFLTNNEYVIINPYLVPIDYIQLQTSNDMCELCFKEGKQKFIGTICNNKICLDCFKELIKTDNAMICPVCRQKNWLICNQQFYENIIADQSRENNFSQNLSESSQSLQTDDYYSEEYLSSSSSNSL